MASGTFKWYSHGLKNMALGNINWQTDNIKVMLTLSTHDAAAGASTHQYRNEVSGYEVLIDTGYVAGGAVLVGAAAEVDISGNVLLKASDLVWADSTITNARNAVIYKARGGDATADELIAYVTFDADVSSVAGAFTLNFDDTNGLLKLTAAV